MLLFQTVIYNTPKHAFSEETPDEIYGVLEMSARIGRTYTTKGWAVHKHASRD
jgi:hypothetical protein